MDQRGVLYLALEGWRGVHNRVSAFKQARELNAADVPFAVVPVALDLLDPQGDTFRVIEAAKAAAERLCVPVGLIVIDTLSRAMAGGNENASEDMGAFVKNVDLIRQALPCHCAIVHHSGKDAARGARGHSLLRAATDTEIEVSRELGTKVSVARVTKQRELDLGDEFAFELVSVELGRDRRGKAVTSCVVRAIEPEARPPEEDRAVQAAFAKDRAKRERERLQDAADETSVLLVVDAERAAGLPGASISWIEDHAECSKARARAAVARLVDRGDLEKVGPYQKATGNGAPKTVAEGYGRPVTVESMLEG